MADNVQDYIENGIYGPKELNPAEKKKYLGTYRERVIVALDKSEVLSKKMLPELEQKIIAYKDSKLLLNGALGYSMLRPYIQIAERTKHEFSIVSRGESDTDIYLVLADTKEVNIPDIHLHAEQKEVEKKEKRSLLDKIKQILN
ncbi:YueI family protein [Listeria fleischmannii]|jgi:uncharacterized protein YueI|uniref:DUF1694 domain-containing protein n=1 Tax=Listeria fleischmannii TaxID=1069827 RepID=A0A841YDE1_9LIST|nr:DUF1694 domain-containing protein [Listeria fleischmannii]MBC1406006.1 DUF1694 domain-containing protein [Listeria welshimeri]EIA19531.1 hypothetical protein KKC_11913 [Listeria fleischmannii subsp. coloradonensis]MBC1398250.1 DUF1694 domain-containing protein [Listeria fleischmannii]MBC1418579.1 DUF1694 domain-containing protein [Listeria fleischmannii]MBC1426311.1 DUF1694 domain-containing protein [Listeria fleischmannii]